MTLEKKKIEKLDRLLLSSTKYWKGFDDSQREEKTETTLYATSGSRLR